MKSLMGSAFMQFSAPFLKKYRRHSNPLYHLRLSHFQVSAPNFFGAYFSAVNIIFYSVKILYLSVSSAVRCELVGAKSAPAFLMLDFLPSQNPIFTPLFYQIFYPLLTNTCRNFKTSKKRAHFCTRLWNIFLITVYWHSLHEPVFP